MTPLRRNILIGAVGILAGIAGIWSSLSSLDAGKPNLAPLWDAQFKDLQGKPVAMASLRGKPLVINFWATWCGPCKEEMPDLQRFATGPDGKKAQIVGIGIDNAANMQAFAKNLGISYLLLEADARGLDILSAAGDKPRALPYTVIVNAAGAPVFTRIGKVNHDDLVRAVSKL